MEHSSENAQHAPWSKGVIVGQKSPFKLKEIWAIRVGLQLQHRVRELAMFDLGLDSKLRTCDLRLATWSRCGCGTSATANLFRPAPP